MSGQHSSEESNEPQSPTSEEAYLSDYIQKHKVPLPGFEDNLSADSDSPPEDTENGSDDSNWLFKKRQHKNDTIPSISMLVPSPTEDVKARIGDQTADEVSDLSEASDTSDVENSLSDEDDETVQHKSLDVSRVLVESKTIIGGKNELSQFETTTSELQQPPSLVSMQSVDNSGPLLTEAKNTLLCLNEANIEKPVLILAQEEGDTPSNGISSTEGVDCEEVVVNKENEAVRWCGTKTPDDYKEIEAKFSEMYEQIEKEQQFREVPVPAPRYDVVFCPFFVYLE